MNRPCATIVAQDLFEYASLNMYILNGAVQRKGHRRLARAVSHLNQEGRLRRERGSRHRGLNSLLLVESPLNSLRSIPASSRFDVRPVPSLLKKKESFSIQARV